MVRVLPTKPYDMSSLPAPIWQEKRTDFHELSFDCHTQAQKVTKSSKHTCGPVMSRHTSWTSLHVVLFLITTSRNFFLPHSSSVWGTEITLTVNMTLGNIQSYIPNLSSLCVLSLWCSLLPVFRITDPFFCVSNLLPNSPSWFPFFFFFLFLCLHLRQ